MRLSFLPKQKNVPTDSLKQFESVNCEAEVDSAPENADGITCSNQFSEPGFVLAMNRKSLVPASSGNRNSPEAEKVILRFF